MDGYNLDCYDYQSTCGANNMLANPIVTFLTTDIPQAWVQVNPFFWVTADHQILTPFFHSCLFLVVYSQCFRGCFFTVGRFGSFFSQLVFLAWTKAPPASFTAVRTTSKNPPSHDSALCTLCLRFHGKSFLGLLLLRIRQHILYLYFV